MFVRSVVQRRGQKTRLAAVGVSEVFVTKGWVWHWAGCICHCHIPFYQWECLCSFFLPVNGFRFVLSLWTGPHVFLAANPHFGEDKSLFKLASLFCWFWFFFKSSIDNYISICFYMRNRPFSEWDALKLSSRILLRLLVSWMWSWAPHCSSWKIIKWSVKVDLTSWVASCWNLIHIRIWGNRKKKTVPCVRKIKSKLLSLLFKKFWNK